ncbi:DNA repair protein RecO [Anaerobiospirillum succiniciproducens]|uniref:DNA repair protein RecO n=1 Tax=Anaerobiospirillum succiniciproducens TaxID=13335 RepID=UPI0023558682|nr:DNA repair protein RecO [Anaerobiospirillum succiniciproducens]MCI6863195.1 DNA repair protein RecO [Anaerobiospirillum succiniciproducens]
MAAVIEHEPCYIYHVRDFQEHSQILEALSLNYGALSIVVNNGKRMNSSTQALFQPFTPLKLSLKRSKGELYFLTDYDCSESGYIFPLPQHFCAVYINELLHHLYKSQNQDIKLFGVYVSTLEAIKNNQNIELSLRIFELTLLESMGYALTLRDDEGLLLEKDSYYRFCFGAGFFKVDKDAMSAVIAQEESLKIATAHKIEPNESFRPIGSMSNHADDDSGMMFPKSKVRGRRLEDSSSYYAYNRLDSSDAYLSMAMRNGFVNEEYMQRYQDLPHDFMGPVLSGDQIRDIVRCDFVMPDSVKLAKQLTGALIERLLNGKEIVSRRLYREYAQMRNAKVRALKEQRLAQEQDKKLQAQTVSVQSETVVNGGSELSINNSSSNNTNDSHATSNGSVGMQSYMHTTEEQSGKKPLYFEAYPQAQLGAENDNSNVGKEPTAPVQPVAPRGYVSQFNHVHRNVPRDKDDAPDFLTEYLNLDAQVSGAVVQNAVQHQPETYKENDSAIAAPTPSYVGSEVEHDSLKASLSDIAKSDEKAHCTQNTEEQRSATVSESRSDVASEEDNLASKAKLTKSLETGDTNKAVDAAVPVASSGSVGEEDHNASKAELSDAAEPDDTDVVKDAAVSESQSDVACEEDHNASKAELSDAAETDDTDVVTEAAVSESQSDVASKEDNLASKAEFTKSLDTDDTNKAVDAAVPETLSGLVGEEDHNALKAELSDASELENADVTNEADDTKSARANEPHATESSESSLDIEVSKNAISDEAYETPKLDAAPTKRKSRASKASSRTKKEADKQKAEEKKAKQKAALKAKAEKKKELERAKAAAKKEAEKLKAAAKREAEKAKAQAKKEAEKAKAAAKREAAKIKEAEKKAAQKAKEAERRAALKERAKAKAIADAEAKEAEIDMEFAHSMLAMIDSGMKKRQRQSKKQSLEE